MGRKIKVGLAGLGSLAQRGILPHTFQDDAREKIDALAVCDNVPGRAKAIAEKWGWRQAYTDYDEMLAHADIEAVLIATPIPLHYRQVMAALKAGKHVYCQKSLTTTLAEADDVVRTARAKGLKLCASPGEMLRPPWPQIRNVVKEGLLGRVYWAIAGMQGSGHENEAFRKEDDVLSNVDPTWYYQKGGGPVYDMTVYCLHELTGILGPVKRVSGMSGIGLPMRRWKDKNIEVEMDDNTLLSLDFDDNTFGVAFGANCRGGVLPRLAIFGTEGTVQAMGPRRDAGIAAPPGPRTGAAARSGVVVTSKHVDGGETELDLPEMPYRVGPHREIGEAHGYADVMHLIDCLLESRDPVPSGEHARHVVEIIEKGYQAARAGKTLELTTTLG
ncbi:MAG TPA: Gfo/Idh/MocA family oxidoreductase [Chloroflexota bacterium]|nr:Gfo/Idh/MocA family oxidoreductase [Chloroflexota bacterium]